MPTRACLLLFRQTMRQQEVCKLCEATQRGGGGGRIPTRRASPIPPAAQTKCTNNNVFYFRISEFLILMGVTPDTAQTIYGSLKIIRTKATCASTTKRLGRPDGTYTQAQQVTPPGLMIHKTPWWSFKLDRR